jgi:hypothetical protein
MQKWLKDRNRLSEICDSNQKEGGKGYAVKGILGSDAEL